MPGGHICGLAVKPRQSGDAGVASYHWAAPESGVVAVNDLIGGLTEDVDIAVGDLLADPDIPAPSIVPRVSAPLSMNLRCWCLMPPWRRH